jgi:hypothetical protein
VTNGWPRLFGNELRRSALRLLGRMALIAVGAGLLVGFVSVLPAYRATFTAALESARFDLDLNGFFHPGDVRTIRNVAGVEAATPVFGIYGVPITHGSHSASAWVWAVDESADLTMLPLNPSFVREGRFDLGTPTMPSVVLDQELAAAIVAIPGDDVTIEANSQTLSARVSAITGPAARLRGPSLLISRSAIVRLMPPEVEAQGAYTEVLLRGTATPTALRTALSGTKFVLATKDEEIDLQQQQIEVSPPVIDVSSWLALVGLIGMVALLAWQSRERRKDLLSVARDLGTPRMSLLLGYLLLEGAPAAVAAGIGAAVVLEVFVNGYFANLGVHIEPRVVLSTTLVLVVAILLAHAASLAIPARALRAAR